jgi:CheY-like chemotaxis protein
MHKGGRLTLCLEKEDLTNHDPKKNLLLPAGPYLVFTVSDTGCGMDEKVRGKIFEPFFTTKEAKGSGLGLATVYGIVRQNNGMIVFDSCPGAGSTFKVYLPRLDVESDTSVNVEITAEATKTAGGPTLQSAVTTATIMVAEDHGTVRKMIRQSLRTTGYTVLEAANADEALTLCKKYTLPIDLIISDIVMPGKCGVELVEELVQLYPSMKVLFISGYRGENELTSHLLSGKEAFLAKPFSAKTLLEKVHQILTSQ